MTKKEFVQSERAFTISLLRGLSTKQWQASTLCKGWTVEDLAAHLASRERNPIGGIGLIVPGLHFLHDKRIEKTKAKGHAYILKKLSHYPWWMAAALNTAEFYVHNEDILRGGLKMHRPVPGAEASEILWQALHGLVRVKKDMVADLGNVQLRNSKTGAIITIPNHHAMQDTVVSGPAGEVLLYFYGRRKAAKVSITKAAL